MKKENQATIDQLLQEVETNKYLLSLSLMVESVKIAIERGQTIPIGNYYTNLIQSSKKSLYEKKDKAK